MRYFLHLAYRGNNYRGWQRQPKVRSVQETLEKCLSKVCRQEIGLVGCGRTDAEVHASDYYAHFDLDAELTDRFLYKINLTLPDDIAILNTFILEGNYHARYSATQRTYDYFIHTKKDPFRDKLSTYLFEDCSKWNLKAMQEAAAILPQYSDFLSFCKVPDKHDSTICQLSEARFYFDEKPNSIRFQITSNRFLRGMVRLIVAQLMDIGRGRVTVEQFEQRIANGKRAEYFVSAPPQGLYLSKVVYPFLGEEIVVGE